MLIVQESKSIKPKQPKQAAHMYTLRILWTAKQAIQAKKLWFGLKCQKGNSRLTAKLVHVFILTIYYWNANIAVAAQT